MHQQPRLRHLQINSNGHVTLHPAKPEIKDTPHDQRCRTSQQNGSQVQDQQPLDRPGIWLFQSQSKTRQQLNVNNQGRHLRIAQATCLLPNVTLINGQVHSGRRHDWAETDRACKRS